MFFWNFELPTLIIRIHLKHSFVFHLNSKGERELKDDHKHSCHWQGSWRSKRWLDQAYGALDNLYQGFHSPLNLYSEFCVYKYFLEEEVCGRYQKFMVPQIMHEWCSQVEGSWDWWRVWLTGHYIPHWEEKSQFSIKQLLPGVTLTSYYQAFKFFKGSKCCGL